MIKTRSKDGTEDENAATAVREFRSHLIDELPAEWRDTVNFGNYLDD